MQRGVKVSMERYKVVLVDDSIATLNQGKAMLRTFYRVYPIRSAAELFNLLERVIPDLILLDVMMSDMSGFEVMRKPKADDRYSDIPVIFLTSKSDEGSELEGLNLGAVDYIAKPFSGPLLHKRILNQIRYKRAQTAIKDYANNLEIKVHEKTVEVIALQSAIISTVSELIEFRDHDTGGHITRTQRYMRALVGGLIAQGLYEEKAAGWNLDLLLLSSQLHDVGKIAIPDGILNKPGKLTDDEFETIKTHVPAGVGIIEKIMDATGAHENLHYALIIAGTHHEKWDGSGYPMGLSKHNIPLLGRLMAIADVYDALVSERPYKKPLTHDEAGKIIIDGAGKHFDPDLTEIFSKVENEFAEAK